MNKLINYFFFSICVLLYSTYIQAQVIPKWKISDLELYISKSQKPLIINFWATFCKPCIEEIPYFQKTTKEFKNDSVELLLVSLDNEKAYDRIKPFATKYKFTAPIIFLDENDPDVFCPRVDSTWSGALPASLFVNNQTGYRKFYEEQLPKEKLKEEIKNLINEHNRLDQQ